jgi:hypothetical protein
MQRRSIKGTATTRDVVYTPIPLARKCIDIIPLIENDILLDPCRGKGAFYDQFPKGFEKDYCEVDENKDFFRWSEEVDWCISNPPYSILDEWLDHSATISRKGFGYLISYLNLTVKRIMAMNERGFYLRKLLLINKVQNWFGKSCFIVFMREPKENIVLLDKKEYHSKNRNDKMKIYRKQPEDQTDLEQWF